MALEGIRKARRDIETETAKAAVKDPLSGEQMELGAHAKSQAEIWQDPEEQARFIQFLGTKDKRKVKPIIEALSSKKLLTESQQEFVDETVTGYNIRTAERSRLESILTPEYVRNIADADKSIALMVKQIGLDQVHTLLRGQLEKLSLENEKEYKKLVASMAQERALSESGWAQTVDAKVTYALQRIGIPEDQLGRYVAKSMNLAGGFDSGEKSALELAAQENMNPLMTIADIVSRSAISHRRARTLIESFQHQRTLLHDSNIHLSDIAKALNASITPEQRLEMQRVVLEGGEMKDAQETNVNTIQDYKSVKEEHSEKARDKRLEDLILKKMKARKLNDPSKLTDPDKLDIRKEFADGEEGLQKKHVGRTFFSALLSVLFPKRADLDAEALKKLP